MTVRSNTRMHVRAFAVVALSLVPLVAAAAPHGTVLLRNGTKFEDVDYEVQGQKVKVTLKWGAQTFRMSEIESLTPKAADAGEDDDADEGPTTSDWQMRFKVIPPEGWEAAPATMPLVRVCLRHTQYDADLSVSVRPVVSPWTIPTTGRFEVPRSVLEQIQADVSMFYARPVRATVAVGSYRECPVFRVAPVTVATFRQPKGGDRTMSEMRFQRFGFEYAVTYTVKKADEGVMRHEANKALASFSFLPPLSSSDGFYGDYAQGFALRTPNEDWTVRASPFHETRPVRLTTAGERGEVSVQVVQGRDALVAVSDMLAKRKAKSKYFRNATQSEGVQGGIPIARFDFQDFRAGGRKELHFQGFAAAAQGKVLVFMGIAPRSDEDARKIDNDVKAILDSVMIYDVAQLTEALTRDRNALRFFSQGLATHLKAQFAEAIQRYDDAIELIPDFALAYFLRGRAKKNVNDLKGYEKDLLTAQDLDGTQGFGQELAKLTETRALVAERTKDWGTAVSLWVRVYQNGKTPASLAKLLRVSQELRKDYATKKEFRDGANDLDKRLKPLRKTPAIHKFLAETFRIAGDNLVRAGETSRARGMVSKLKKLGKSVKNPGYIQMANRLDFQIKAKRR